MRTHTSAHQTHFISQGIPAFLCSGDVYRRDEIDASHYPVFHQMEGVRIFERTLPAFNGKSDEEKVKVSPIVLFATSLDSSDLVLVVDH